MNKVNLYKRYPLMHSPLIYSKFFQVQQVSSKNNKDNDSNFDKKTNSEALKKLNLILKQIVQDDAIVVSSNIELAKPKPKKTSVTEDESKIDRVQLIDKDVISSVKSVAKSFSGNVKRTETELLSKLLNSDNISTGNKPSPTNLSDIVKGMKIDTNKESIENLSRAQQLRDILKQSKEPNTEFTQSKFVKNHLTKIHVGNRDKGKIDLFGKDSLKIFTDINQYVESEINETWRKLHDRDLRLAVTHPPTNYFQQMILWTEQGKMWKFPIDNEQGMEEEQNISFIEHVFLENYLEPWCPSKGPIRYFMELVCVGLSKNPYMSSKDKQEHIEWYKQYFQDKRKLLEDVGAIPSEFKEKDVEAVTKNVMH